MQLSYIFSCVYIFEMLLLSTIWMWSQWRWWKRKTMRNLSEYLTTCIPTQPTLVWTRTFRSGPQKGSAKCFVLFIRLKSVIYLCNIPIKKSCIRDKLFMQSSLIKSGWDQTFAQVPKKSNAWQPGWRLPSSENCLTGQHMSQASMYLNCHRAESVKSDLVSTWLDQCFFHNLFHQRGILYIHMCETTKGPQSLFTLGNWAFLCLQA